MHCPGCGTRRLPPVAAALWQLRGSGGGWVTLDGPRADGDGDGSWTTPRGILAPRGVLRPSPMPFQETTRTSHCRAARTLSSSPGVHPGSIFRLCHRRRRPGALGRAWPGALVSKKPKLDSIGGHDQIAETDFTKRLESCLQQVVGRPFLAPLRLCKPVLP